MDCRWRPTKIAQRLFTCTGQSHIPLRPTQTSTGALSGKTIGASLNSLVPIKTAWTWRPESWPPRTLHRYDVYVGVAVNAVVVSLCSCPRYFSHFFALFLQCGRRRRAEFFHLGKHQIFCVANNEYEHRRTKIKLSSFSDISQYKNENMCNTRFMMAQD